MNNKKLIIAVIALCAVLGLMLGVYFGTRPAASQGSKTFTVTVVHADGSEKEFSYRTDEDKLGAFLEEKGLINSEGADQGMFHTVDGEKAVWDTSFQSYWAFYENGEYAMTGIYDTDITDGAAYSLVYTLG